MAVTQADFAQALSDFAADVTAGLTTIQAAIGEPLDLQPELDKLNEVKTAFDSFVASVTPPAPAPEPPPAQ